MGTRPSLAHDDGHVGVTSGPASPEKTLTEGALGHPTDEAISIIVVGACLVALAICVVVHYLVT